MDQTAATKNRKVFVTQEYKFDTLLVALNCNVQLQSVFSIFDIVVKNIEIELRPWTSPRDPETRTHGY